MAVTNWVDRRGNYLYYNLNDAVVAPLPAPSPHDARKNRYVSFVPNNPANIAFSVEMTASEYFPDSVGALGWVGEPDEAGVARVVDEPFFSDAWPALVHVGDCKIVPVAAYEIRGTVDGTSFTEPLELATIARPEPGMPKWWADLVGLKVEGAWSPPDGFVNMDDIQAAIQAFEDTPGEPHWTWVDVADEGPDRVINMTDIQFIIFAFEGAGYPFSDPSDCP
jgi:hypothetical protein